MAFRSVTAENIAGEQKTVLKDAVKFVSNQEYFLLNCLKK